MKDKFQSIDFGLLRRPPDSNTWIALVIAGRNAIIYDTDIATGFFTSKIRELQSLGYHAALVSKLVKYELKKSIVFSWAYIMCDSNFLKQSCFTGTLEFVLKIRNSTRKGRFFK